MEEFKRFGGIADRIAVVGIVVGASLALATVFLPPEYLAAIPAQWRIDAFWMFVLIAASGSLFLFYDLAKAFPRIRLLFILTEIVVGESLVMFFTWNCSWWVRGGAGAIAGSLLSITIPYTFPKSREVVHDINLVVQTGHGNLENAQLITRAHNFANSLRNFRSDFNTENERWRKMEWSAFNPEQSPAEKEKIRNNNDRDEGRRREFLNIFLQSYNETAIILFYELNGKLEELAIVPNPRTFNTPLPPGFNTFKVTLDGVSRNKFLDEGFVGRAADYYDTLADALAGEKKPAP